MNPLDEAMGLAPASAPVRQVSVSSTDEVQQPARGVRFAENGASKAGRPKAGRRLQRALSVNTALRTMGKDGESLREIWDDGLTGPVPVTPPGASGSDADRVVRLLHGAVHDGFLDKGGERTYAFATVAETNEDGGLVSADGWDPKNGAVGENASAEAEASAPAPAAVAFRSV